MEQLNVLAPGMYTTVQDLGREPYRIYGIAPSGAADALSLRIGNILVGNADDAAGIEATWVGPRLAVAGEGVLCVTGADMSPRLNGQAVPMWRSFAVRDGDVLELGQATIGCRAYIAVAGGIDVPPVMGSRATFVRGGYGGLEGRTLRAGDALPVGTPSRRAAAGRSLPARYRPDYRAAHGVRFIRGPQADRFAVEALPALTSGAYAVRKEADRMGVRLSGAPLTHASGADIISDTVVVGSIQVPGEGQPIVLLADSQVTGGYAKIGTVIGVDLPHVAQWKPGDTVRFAEIGVEEAQRLWTERERLLRLLRLHNG